MGTIGGTMALDALNDLVGKLPELKAEHDRLGRLIDAIEAFAQNGAAPPVSAPSVQQGGRVVLRPDLFYGKSTAEATKMYLQMVGHSLSLREIAHALVQGGLGSDVKVVYANVSSALKRLKNTGEVDQPKRNQWGLSIWYGGPKKKRDQNGDADESAQTTAAKAAAALAAGVVA
jgi:hypothetical protein